MAHSSRVRYASLSGFQPVCDELGLDHRALMGAHRLDPERLQHPDSWASAAAVAAVFEAAAEDGGCATVGLRMAGYRNSSALGPISLVLAEEPTLRGVLAILRRFWPSYNESLRLRLVEQGDAARLQITFDLQLGRPPVQAIELCAAVVVQLVGQRVPDGQVIREVTFAHEGSGEKEVGEHERLLGVGVRFDAECDEVVLDRAALDEQLPHVDPQRVAYARQFLETLPTAASADRVEQIRKVAEDLLPVGRCSASGVARTLGVDRRTLHRWLAAERLSFSDLLCQVRRVRAEGYLGADSHSLTEIAELTGFSALSSFSRWFRSEYGISPSQWTQNRSPAD